MEKAAVKAHTAFANVQQEYTCCVRGKTVGLHEFPGAVTGHSSEKFGVLHCMTGFFARQLDAGTSCLAAAYLYHELMEFIQLGEWLPSKEGPVGWFLDTYSDMTEVFTGAQLGALEECIPNECSKRTKK
jgi:hypothetical protein